ncbi:MULTISPECIES: hypothetical protein [Streptomyces]|uniref:Uncharacterized protein n=1 Tax=Streptomyces muensis TaxID=1077944 RepID=A0A9X1PS50_STRM4|nr:MULTISPECIES: hypothetical protein [Streptomyces]MCF1592502.1 hypothetical protein [Streptomyces muensis]QKV98303.1 hypothetical protein HUT19_42060 [Streptomyces sp. NA02950]
MTDASRVRIRLRGRRRDAETPSGTETAQHLAGHPAPAAVAVPGRRPAEPERPADLVLRFRTRGGSYVDITGQRHGKTNWRCHGCLFDLDLTRELTHTREEANDHAANCWAIDLSTPRTVVVATRPKSRVRFSGRRS